MPEQSCIDLVLHVVIELFVIDPIRHMGFIYVCQSCPHLRRRVVVSKNRTATDSDIPVRGHSTIVPQRLGMSARQIFHITTPFIDSSDKNIVRLFTIEF